MVEVFKTNVTSSHQAHRLVQAIEQTFDGCKANFDLDDCDRILRVAADRTVEAQPMLLLLKEMGVNAEVLRDEVQDMNQLIRPRWVLPGFGFALMLARRTEGELKQNDRA